MNKEDVRNELKYKLNRILRSWLPNESYGYNEAIDEILDLFSNEIEKENK